MKVPLAVVGATWRAPGAELRARIALLAKAAERVDSLCGAAEAGRAA